MNLAPSTITGLAEVADDGTARGHRSSRAEDAYTLLRERIVRGELMPNERLIELDLAAWLGLGRSAVRTFLARLEQEGLVVREPNRGARVRMVGEAEALEILQARAALEALTVRAAAVHATDDDVAAMRATLADMAERIQTGDPLVYSDANARLHATIIEISRHRTAARLIAGLNAQTVRFQYRTVLVPGRALQSLAEHTAIVDAIAVKDCDAAEAAMHRHLSHVAGALRQTASARAQRERRGPDDRNDATTPSSGSTGSRR